MTAGAPSARDRRFARPFVFLFLNLPYGVSSGFATMALPFILTRAGYSVATAASITALALVPGTWRFLVAPVTDATWTLHRWFLVGTAACAAGLVAFGLTPIRTDNVALVTAMVVLSQVGAQLPMVPAGGLMALVVDDAEKGRAGGWFMAGNLGGGGLGGGAAVWLVAHGSVLLATLVLAGAVMLCAVALVFVPAVPRGAGGGAVGARVRVIGRDFLAMLRSPRSLLVVILVMTPIGVGASANLWSSIAPAWRATPDQVALATGLLNGLGCGLGSAIGGWLSDRLGRWWMFFGTGVGLALVAIGWAFMARSPAVFMGGVAVFSLVQGASYAAYAAVVLDAIGRGAAATKYSTLTSLGNLPVAYMTALVGRAHTRWGAGGVLVADGLAALAVVPLALAGLWLVRRRERATGPASAQPGA